MESKNIERAVVTGPDHFKSHGYAIIDVPAPSAAVLDSFNRMPRDEHSPSRLRQIRLSQYFTFCDEGQWTLALLPRRKYVQSAEYIRLAEAGGVMRHREQLEVDPTPVVAAVLDALGVDKDGNYQINVNQIRVIANGDFTGVPVPEGPHRDGHKYSCIVIAARHNVRGGETQIMDPQTEEVLHAQTLGENQAVLIDDERYIHYVTNFTPADGSMSYRDIWVIEVNPWAERAYGPAHERCASAVKYGEAVPA